ncbi:MAG TPA: hypothetical protein VF160_06830 [Candidatus Dormibacteraeota bacterium]
MGIVEVAAVVVAWLGGAFLVLSDARRGIALGMALYSAGLAAVLFTAPLAAVALGGAGLVGAALRLRDGRRGWGTLPPGSTPRLLLCVVAGVLTAFVGSSILEGPGSAPMRVTILLGGALGAARLLSTRRREAALASTAVMTLAVGAAEASTGGPAAATVVLAAALGAILLGVLPGVETDIHGT